MGVWGDIYLHILAWKNQPSMYIKVNIPYSPMDFEGMEQEI